VAEKDPESRYERTLLALRKNPLTATIMVAALVLSGIASTSKNLREMISLVASMRHGQIVPVELPFETGWVFCGYFDTKEDVWLGSAPFCHIEHSPFPKSANLPRTGDLLRLAADRRLVILDFASRGLTRRFDPPWLVPGGSVRNEDYTGLVLKEGAVLEARDVQPGQFPGRPWAVWVRVGRPNA